MRNNQRGGRNYSAKHALCIWSAGIVVLYMWTSYERWYCRKQEVHLIRAGFVLHPKLLHKEGPTTRSQVWESTWDAKSTVRQINFKEKCRKKKYDNIHGPIHPATRPSGRRWLSWDALKKSSLRWIGLQAKITVILPPEQKLTSTVATGGFARMWWISIRVPTRHQPDFKKALLTLYRLKKARRTRSNLKSGRKVPPRGWQWQTNWWESDYEKFTTKMGVTTDWTGWLVYSVGNYCICGMNLSKNWIQIFLNVNLSVTADSSLLSPTGGCKIQYLLIQKFTNKMTMKMVTEKCVQRQAHLQHRVRP